MRLIDQPRNGSIGNELLTLMESGGFEKLYMMVAYVRQSGLDTIRAAVDRFKLSGGQIWVVAGIGQKNTSYEGLKGLLEICDRVWVFHNESFSFTFHPKAYAFEKAGTNAVLLVGSGNLTEGGLFTNYEAAIHCNLDLTRTDDAQCFSEFIRMFQEYCGHKKCSIELTSAVLEDLQRKNYILDERHMRTAIKKGSTHTRKRFFGSESFSAPSIAKRTEPRKVRASRARPKPASAVPTRGRIVWKKSNLPSSDAQQTQKGTNPTGCLRLTRAGWKSGGAIIDQTRYFRETLFGRFKWKQEKKDPFVEITHVRFRLRIKGSDKGEHRLEIRHKPSGEARQGNYTTSMSWGALTAVIRPAKLKGSTLSLYEPSTGKEPFFIEFN